MLYEMLTGYNPFESGLPSLTMQRPLTGLPAELSAECRQLLEGMLHPDPYERMTVSHIKQHPWFLRCVCKGTPARVTSKAQGVCCVSCLEGLLRVPLCMATQSQLIGSVTTGSCLK